MFWTILANVFLNLFLVRDVTSETSVVFSIQLNDIPNTVRSTSLLVVSYYPVGAICASCDYHIQQYEQIASDLTTRGMPVRFGKSQVPKINSPYLMFYAYGHPKEPSYLGEMNKDLVKNWIITHVKYSRQERIPGRSQAHSIYTLSGGKFDDSVIILTRDTFDTGVVEYKEIVILFYSSKDAKSKKFLPIFTIIARELIQMKSPIRLGKIDTFKNKQILFIRTTATVNVPFLVFYKNGQEKKHYRGEMSKKPILEWIINLSKQNGYPDDDIGTPQQEQDLNDQPTIDSTITISGSNLKKIISSHPYIVIFFYNPEEPSWPRFYPIFTQIIREVRIRRPIVKVGKGNIAVNPGVIRGPTGRFPIVHFYKNGRQFPPYTGILQAKPIVRWIYKHFQEPGNEYEPQDDDRVMIITLRTFPTIIKRHPKVVVVYYEPDHPSWPAFEPTLTEIDRRLKAKPQWNIIIAKYNIEEGTSIVIPKVRSPPFIYYYEGGKLRSEYKGRLDIRDLLNWIYTQANIDQQQQDQDVLELEVIKIRSKTHLEKILQDNIYVVVATYPTSCCWDFYEIYNVIARELKFRNIKFAEILEKVDDVGTGTEKYIYLVLYKNGKKIATYKVPVNNYRKEKQRIIQWIIKKTGGSDTDNNQQQQQSNQEQTTDDIHQIRFLPTLVKKTVLSDSNNPGNIEYTSESRGPGTSGYAKISAPPGSKIYMNSPASSSTGVIVAASSSPEITIREGGLTAPIVVEAVSVGSGPGPVVSSSTSLNSRPGAPVKPKKPGKPGKRGFMSGDTSYNASFSTTKEVNGDKKENKVGTIEMETDYFIPFKRRKNKRKNGRKN